MQGFKHPARLALALAFGFVTASAAAAQEPAPQPAPAPAPEEPAPAPEQPAPERCEIVIEAAGIPVSAEPVTVRAAFSRAIGETVAAEIAAESGVSIVAAEADEAMPLTLALTLDTSAAEAGEWPIALRGEDGACEGTIAVMPASPPPSL